MFSGAKIKITNKWYKYLGGTADTEEIKVSYMEEKVMNWIN